MNRRDFLHVATGVLVAPAAAYTQSSLTWEAGVATVDITPANSLWMAGFARRTQTSQGAAQSLHAKALALQVGRESPVVLVTADLLGLTARIASGVAAQVQRRHRIPRANLLFNASHTHCGPVVDEQLSVAYDLSPAQWQAIREYSDWLEDKLVAVITEAVSRLGPARLAYGVGEAGFAANRRVSFTPDGPVDRSVPVLRVERADGPVLAIVFGYACHNTTLGDTFVKFHGDYAGVAQAVLEERHAGTTALFVAGCGADANPRPRGTLEHVHAHGTALADAVDRVLPSLTPLAPNLHTGYAVVNLPFADDATRERWRSQLKIDEVYLKRHAALMTAALARDGRLPRAQPNPVQVWQIGPRPSPKSSAKAAGVTLVALGGEVVVDYALRLAREYPDHRVWAAGYCNDVFGYVPSLRVLREGGYEGADAMIYYGRPGPFTEQVEELIIEKIRQLVRDKGGRRP